MGAGGAWLHQRLSVSLKDISFCACVRVSLMTLSDSKSEVSTLRNRSESMILTASSLTAFRHESNALLWFSGLWRHLVVVSVSVERIASRFKAEVKWRQDVPLRRWNQTTAHKTTATFPRPRETLISVRRCLTNAPIPSHIWTFLTLLWR